MALHTELECANNHPLSEYKLFPVSDLTSAEQYMSVVIIIRRKRLVSDPYGKWLLVTGSYDTTVSGKGQKYPKAAFERVTTDNGLGNDLWLHTFK